MAMANPAFEDVFPIENGDVRLPCWFSRSGSVYIYINMYICTYVHMYIYIFIDCTYVIYIYISGQLPEW